MTNRFYSPDQQFVGNDGVPLTGGQLFFYATGTSTLQNTYSDQALSVANTNPVVLDSNGYANSIFLQNLAYKVVLEDSDNNQIWTMDPVYTSDYSTYAAFQPWNGNPNGLVAGFAGTVGALPPTSAIWDYVDNILYICTTTGNAATAVWTAVNANSATQITPQPQGYLTLSNDANNPILTSDSIASTAVYYSPYTGNVVPVFNGASFAVTTFSQLVLTLTASQALNTIYDVFVFNNSGVLTLVTGPAWTTSTAGAGARGTGAGTTQLQRLSGLWVNAVQITARNGSTTYTVPANTATYLGSIFIDGTAGQVTCHRSYGQSRKWGVWNAYNRQPVYMQAGDATTNWSYNSATVRAANNNPANSISLFTGLAECQVSATYKDSLVLNTTAATEGGASIAIGLNSTTVLSGAIGSFRMIVGPGPAAYSSTAMPVGTAVLTVQPSLGVNVITALEFGNGVSNTNLFLGTSINMLLNANYVA